MKMKTFGFETTMASRAFAAEITARVAGAQACGFDQTLVSASKARLGMNSAAA